MGGGSSDAASTLLALNRLWGLNWPRQRLAALGLKLGADVPFFIGGHNAFVEGIGELLTPLPVPPAWLAVLKPAASIETRAIFGSPLLVRDTEAVILSGFLADTAGSMRRVLDGFGRNDLQPPAEAHCADVVTALELLQRRFGNARMTGSGSAVFARAGTGAEPTAAMPADLPPGWVGRMCRSLEQHPLVGWARD
jgi:4-diphosphocytidyl-2-C-methyl-D-erythritol kinase